MTDQNNDAPPDERQAEAARRLRVREALRQLLRLLADGIAADLLAREAQAKGCLPAGEAQGE